jgi:hypothetical protein
MTGIVIARGGAAWCGAVVTVREATRLPRMVATGEPVAERAHDGRSCASGWAGPCNAPSGGPANATSRPSPAGSPTSGPDQRGVRRIGLDRLLRRIGRLADPAGAPDLVRTQSHTKSFGISSAGRRASMAAALSYRPPGTAARLGFHLQQPNVWYFIWDGLSAHWSTR